MPSKYPKEDFVELKKFISAKKFGDWKLKEKFILTLRSLVLHQPKLFDGNEGLILLKDANLMLRDCINCKQPRLKANTLKGES